MRTQNENLGVPEQWVLMMAQWENLSLWVRKLGSCLSGLACLAEDSVGETSFTGEAGLGGVTEGEIWLLDESVPGEDLIEEISQAAKAISLDEEPVEGNMSASDTSENPTWQPGEAVLGEYPVGGNLATSMDEDLPREIWWTGEVGLVEDSVGETSCVGADGLDGEYPVGEIWWAGEVGLVEEGLGGVTAGEDCSSGGAVIGEDLAWKSWLADEGSASKTWQTGKVGLDENTKGGTVCAGEEGLRGAAPGEIWRSVIPGFDDPVWEPSASPAEDRLDWDSSGDLNSRPASGFSGSTPAWSPFSDILVYTAVKRLERFEGNSDGWISVEYWKGSFSWIMAEEINESKRYKLLVI
jgi:hypothetical protein